MRDIVRAHIPRPMRARIRRACYFPVDLLDHLMGRQDQLKPPRSKMNVGAGDFAELGRSYLKLFVNMGRLTPAEVGRRYCAFLASDGGETFVVSGVNGLFEVDSDETLVRSSRRIPVTLGAVRNLVRKAED